MRVNLTNTTACPQNTRCGGYVGEQHWMCVLVLLAFVAQGGKWTSKQTKNKQFYIMLSVTKENRVIWLVWRKVSMRWRRLNWRMNKISQAKAGYFRQREKHVQRPWGANVFEGWRKRTLDSWLENSAVGLRGEIGNRRVQVVPACGPREAVGAQFLSTLGGHWRTSLESSTWPHLHFKKSSLATAVWSGDWGRSGSQGFLCKD